MRKKKLLSVVTVIIAALLAAAGLVSADRPGSSAGQFLMLGPGGRPAALGNAYTAAATGADALYWNPAGLGRLERSEITLMHSRWFQDVAYNYAAFAWEEPVLDGHLAGGLTLLDYGEINITRIAGQNPVTGLGKTDANDYAITAGYGRAWDLFDWGVAVKYIHQQIAGSQDDAFACDLGVLINQTPLPNLRVGASLLNLGTKIRMQSQSYRIPLTFKVGAAYQAPTLPLLLTADCIVPKDDRVVGAVGLEYTIVEMLALRVGYSTENDAGNGIAAGAGFSPNPDFNVDYAFVPYGDLGDAHRVSLNYRFGLVRRMAAPAPPARVARAAEEEPPTRRVQVEYSSPAESAQSAASPAPPAAVDRTLAVRGLIAQGLEQFQADSYADACASFGEASRLEPGNTVAAYNMASSYYAAGEFRGANEWYGYYITLVPTDPRGYVDHGACLDRLGRRAEAEAAWRQALAIDPGNETARQLLEQSRR